MQLSVETACDFSSYGFIAAETSCWRHSERREQQQRRNSEHRQKLEPHVSLGRFIVLHLEDEWINVFLLMWILWRKANSAKRDTDVWAS